MATARERKNKNHPEHALYLLWCNLLKKHDVCKEWSDFNNFVKDIKDRKIGYKFRRIDNTKPFSLDNFIWEKSISSHTLYSTWSNMIQGGRHKVCKEWHDFNNFLKDVGEKKKNHIFTRIDNNELWGPDNYRWKQISLKNSD